MREERGEKARMQQGPFATRTIDFDETKDEPSHPARAAFPPTCSEKGKVTVTGQNSAHGKCGNRWYDGCKWPPTSPILTK